MKKILEHIVSFMENDKKYNIVSSLIMYLWILLLVYLDFFVKYKDELIKTMDELMTGVGDVESGIRGLILLVVAAAVLYALIYAPRYLFGVFRNYVIQKYSFFSTPKKHTHIYDFVDEQSGLPLDGVSHYAVGVLHRLTLNATLAISMKEAFGEIPKLYCDYEGKRWEVTAASRSGHIQLNYKDDNSDIVLYVYPDQVTNYGENKDG